VELPIVSPFVTQQHVPSGAAASAATLRGQAAGAAGGRGTGTVVLTVCATGAPGPGGAALLLRVLAHGAPGLVQVPVASQRLRVGAPPAFREHAGAC
jgi:hypothetical protein